MILYSLSIWFCLAVNDYYTKEHFHSRLNLWRVMGCYTSSLTLISKFRNETLILKQNFVCKMYTWKLYRYSFLCWHSFTFHVCSVTGNIVKNSIIHLQSFISIHYNSINMNTGWFCEIVKHNLRTNKTSKWIHISGNLM